MAFRWWQEQVRPLDEAARLAALARQGVLTKPAGSLGELESIAVALAAMQSNACPSLRKPWISIFAGDHGIAVAGVSAYPQAVTAQMVANFARGGAAICVLAREIGATLEVVDVGVAGDTTGLTGVEQRKVALGTANLLEGPAMSREQCELALAAGCASVNAAREAGADCFMAGEMGIANTSSASILAAALLGETPSHLSGPGTGLDAAGVARKGALLDAALIKHASVSNDAHAVLSALGGFEIAAMAGAYIAAAQTGIPILVDGFISTVAALVATRLNPGVRQWMLFAHQSAEPAHARVLAALSGRPVLTLGMRLGEGSGAATAFPLLKLACALHAQMATFGEAGVSTAVANESKV
ncbi:nicotinate-nucleotide--dimethylbenzimidazole phosphoribosyltransferase [Burkholderiaceae bacterium DAT-1]|nr:nicotinate-nucleotide--dimethylbenzimidazole phosphoribosyltransferase [Burkholderiaceae bacterium DAT-1]